MKLKLVSLRLLASLCNLNYLQISVKGKSLNSEKKILIDLLRREVLSVTLPNITKVKYNPKISIIHHQIKISKRYNEQVFNKTAALKNFAIFTEKHLRGSLLLSKNAGLKLKLYQKEASTQICSCEYCEIFKNTYFREHLWTAVWTFSYMSK